MSMGPYKNLQVWQMAMALAKEVYNTTASYPKSETFGLVSQMRRCVVSIASNIAEGYGRGTNNDLVHFLYISLGSSNELETQLLLSRAFSYIEEGETQALLQKNEQVGKMLSSLIYKRTHAEIQSAALTSKNQTPTISAPQGSCLQGPQSYRTSNPQGPQTPQETESQDSQSYRTPHPQGPQTLKPPKP